MVNKRTRRLHVATLLLALAAVLLTIPVAAGTAAKPSGAAAPAGSSCRLSVFSWWTGGGEAAGLQRLIQIWNRTNKNCPFKNETVAGGAGTNAKAVLAQRLAAGNPPDSFQGHAGKELLDYIKAGQVEPIDFIYKRYGLRKVMPKQLISQITYRGHLYSVPVNIHRANVLWYNPSILRRAGVNAVPKTWAQFVAALEKVKDTQSGVTPLSLGEQWTQKHLF